MTDALPAPTRSDYDRLPRRLKRFVDRIAAGETAEGAMRASGYTGKYPCQLATKWLKKPKVKRSVEEATARLVADIGVRQVTVMRQMASIAQVDPRRLEDADGNTIPLHKLDAETAAAISSVEIEDVSKDGFTGKRYKYKFWDKVKANDRLGQYVKLWEQRATNVNVDARSVTLNVDRGSEEAIRALADIGSQIAALGAGQVAAPADQDRLVLPAEVCDGSAGCGASVDAGEGAGDPGTA